MKTVFLSSTSADLQAYRDTVAETLKKMGVGGSRMEDWGAGDDTPLEKCLEEVSKTDIYIGIIAYSYGSFPKDHTISFTEAEYDKAKELGLPCYCFIVADDQPWLPQFIQSKNKQKLKRFKKKIRSEKVVETFTTPDNLAKKVAEAMYKTVSLTKLLKNRYYMIKEAIDFINQNPVEEMKIAALSGHWISYLLSIAAENEIKVTVLLQTPDAIIDSTSSKMMEGTADSYKRYVDTYGRASFYLYKTVAVLDGILLDDNFVTFGSYTYSSDIYVKSRSHVRVMAKKGSKESQYAFDYFNEVFDDLRHDATPLDDYLRDNPIDIR